MAMKEVELTVLQSAAPRLVRRRSAGGMALHHWQEVGKPTVIQVVMELAGDGISTEALTQLVDVRLLKRFPRFRGYVSENARHWVVPEAVDPSRYVSDVALEGSDQRTALLALLGAEFRKPLPARCSWEVRRVTCAGRIALVWRIAHTAADGVILTQLLTHVLCDAPAQAASAPAAPATSSTAEASGSGNASVARPQRSGMRASCLERVWAFVCGLLKTAFLLCWPADRRTAISLGPSAWRRRQRQRRKQTDADEGASIECTQVVLSRAVGVAALKAAARQHDCTINDVVLAALGAGLHQHLAQVAIGSDGNATMAAAALARLEHLTLTATVVVNPRQQAFVMSAANAQKLLESYAAMSTYGCDVALGFVPLPCGGALAADARLAAVRRVTRQLKLSPEVALSRWLAIALNFLLGVRAVTILFEHVLAKTSTYVSNVVGPTQPAAFGGVTIDALYFGSAPLDWGLGFSFFSYKGELTVCCVSDEATVPAPQAIVDHVHEALEAYCASVR